MRAIVALFPRKRPRIPFSKYVCLNTPTAPWKYSRKYIMHMYRHKWSVQVCNFCYFLVNLVSVWNCGAVGFANNYYWILQTSRGKLYGPKKKKLQKNFSVPLHLLDILKQLAFESPELYNLNLVCEGHRCKCQTKGWIFDVRPVWAIIFTQNIFECPRSYSSTVLCHWSGRFCYWGESRLVKSQKHLDGTCALQSKYSFHIHH